MACITAKELSHGQVGSRMSEDGKMARSMAKALSHGQAEHMDILMDIETSGNGKKA